MIKFEKENMMKRGNCRRLLISLSLYILVLFKLGLSQDYAADSLAVLSILHDNGIYNRTVESVSDSAGGRITYLELYNLNIESLPVEIGNLDSLKELRLQYNLLASFPEEICNLKSLTRLNLSGNRISSVTPNIKNLNKLQNLYLDSNLLTELPDEIGDLSELVSLWATYNALSFLPLRIIENNKLERLMLDNNNFSLFPLVTCSMSNLTYLSLVNNYLKQIPAELGNSISIEKLYLSHNMISSVSAGIMNLPTLRFLELSHNDLSCLPGDITKFPSIFYDSSWRGLCLGHNKLCNLPDTIKNWLDSIGAISSIWEYLIHCNPLQPIYDCYIEYPLWNKTQSCDSVVANKRLASKSSSFDVYPNPFNPVVNINVGGEGAVEKIDIYYIGGNKICSINVNNLSLVKWDASKYSSGTYLFKIFTRDMIINKTVFLVK